MKKPAATNTTHDRHCIVPRTKKGALPSKDVVRAAKPTPAAADVSSEDRTVIESIATRYADALNALGR